MNPKIDSVIKQAKQSRKQRAQRNLSAAPMLQSVYEKSKQKEASLKVWGPYAEGDSRFRLKIAENGVERSLKFQTQEEAESVKEELLQKYAKITRKTVAEALPEWLEELTPCVKPNTIKNNQKMVAQLPQNLVLGQLTEEQASKLYQQQVERISSHTKRRVSTATQHLFLWVARHFWVWAIGKGYAKMNPWLKVRRVGKANVGKPQLRIDEARKLEAVAMQRAQNGDLPSLGVLLMLYLGLRQGEVAARVVRDIDDDGRVLWIPSGKTRNAKRRLKIPEQMRPLVLKRIQGKKPDELIFYPPNHKTYHRGYFVAQLARLCRLADVPVVCPHGLRGMHATLALEGGATSDAVAKALGHGSFEMTKTHYASASSVANNESCRVAAALAGQSSRSELDRILNQLGQNELESLLIKLRSGGRSGSDIEENRAT